MSQVAGNVSGLISGNVRGSVVSSGGALVAPITSLNFAGNVYSGGGQSGVTPGALSIWSFTRASAKYAATVAGALTSFSSGNPAITDKGLLLEGAATNLAKSSQAFVSAFWGNFAATASDNSVTAPDGTLTGSTLTENNAASTHEFFQGVALTSGAFTQSIFLKNGTRSFAFLNAEKSANDYFSAVYDLNTPALGETKVGTSGAITNSALQSLANGWLRAVATGSVAEAGPNVFLGLASAATGNTFTTFGEITYLGSSKTAIAWQIDVVAAAFVTSPITTVAATATRAADAASLSEGLPAGDWTLSGIVTHERDTGVVQTYVDVNDAGDTNKVIVERLANNTVQARVINGGSSTTIGTSAAKSGARTVKWALTKTGTALSFYVDGTAVASGSSTVPTTTATTLGSNRGATTQLNDYLSRHAIRSAALTSAQAIALTS